jgi:hypothetical protein
MDLTLSGTPLSFEAISHDVYLVKQKNELVKIIFSILSILPSKVEKFYTKVPNYFPKK